MTIKYTKAFLAKLKKQNVRIRKDFKKVIIVFSNNPDDLSLHNHELTREWQGYRSINITADFRAVYKEVVFADELVVYFTTLGTHDELYKSASN